MTLWFDLDGTLADTLARWWELDDEQWIERVRTAKGMINLATFARLARKAQAKGYKLGICSWLTKTNDKRIADAKKEWLKKRLPSIEWDNIDIIANKEPKWLNRDGILFDDNKKNRADWEEHNGTAYNYDEILTVLKAI